METANDGSDGSAGTPGSANFIAGSPMPGSDGGAISSETPKDGSDGSAGTPGSRIFGGVKLQLTSSPRRAADAQPTRRP